MSTLLKQIVSPRDEMHAHILASPSIEKASDRVECLPKLGFAWCRWIGWVLFWRWQRLGCFTGALVSAGQYWIVRNSWPESEGSEFRVRCAGSEFLWRLTT